MNKKAVSWLLLFVIVNSLFFGLNENLTLEELSANSPEKSSPFTEISEIKIHQPGTPFEDDEHLSWAANNLSLYSIMQLSMKLDSVIDSQEIANIEVLGYWIGNTNQFLQFAESNLNFSLHSEAGKSILATNFSYPSTMVSGNYSIDATINFTDGSAANITHTGVYFEYHGFEIYGLNPYEQQLICSCKRANSAINIRNTGEDGNYIDYNFILEDNDNKYADVVITSQNKDDFTGILAGGETISFNYTIEINDPLTFQLDSLSLQFRIELSFENDNGDTITLKQGYTEIIIQVLDDNVDPVVAIIMNGVQENFSNLQNEFVTQLYDLGNDHLAIDFDITNYGYFGQIIGINISGITNTPRVIISDQNLTVQQFNNEEYSVNSTKTISLSIYFDVPSDCNICNLEFYFIDESQNLGVNHTISIVNEPTIDASQIIEVGNSTTDNYSLPIDFQNILNLDFSQYNKIDLFVNNWILSCQVSNDIVIEAVGSSLVCNNNDVYLNFSDSDIEPNYSLQFLISQLNPNEINNFNITFYIQHNPYNLNSNILFTTTLEYVMAESDGPSSDLNNSSPSNNTNDNSSGIGTDNNTDNNTTGTPVDDCADIQCDACPIGMVTDPNGGCCACMEAPETNVDSSNQTGEQGELQNDDSTKTATKESNMPTYLIIGLVIAALVAAVVIIRARKSSETQQNVSNKTITQLPMPALPLPGLPIPSAPVVLQEWTDDNGYSWRQMSDRTIMWWNGSDWIPYGKN